MILLRLLHHGLWNLLPDAFSDQTADIFNVVFPTSYLADTSFPYTISKKRSCTCVETKLCRIAFIHLPSASLIVLQKL